MTHYTHLTNLTPYIHKGRVLQFSTQEHYLCTIELDDNDSFYTVTCSGNPLPGVNQHYNQVILSRMFAAAFTYQDWATYSLKGQDVIKISHHQPLANYPALPPNSMFIYPHPAKGKYDNPITCGYSSQHSLTCYGYYDSDVKGGLIPYRILIGFTITPHGTHIFEYPTPELFTGTDNP